jgi:gamma-glutamylcyclotransferase (GGCT)/AIG2-like uncharacterized protein YtfP
MVSPASSYFFVYSSLRNGFHQGAYDYLTQFFTFNNKAKVKGVLSNADDVAVATPTVDDTFIIGELYKLNIEENFSYVVGQMDDYEGLDALPGEQPLYRREITTVFNEDGTSTQAWIYWFNGDVSNMPLIDSGDVLESGQAKS